MAFRPLGVQTRFLSRHLAADTSKHPWSYFRKEQHWPTPPRRLLCHKMHWLEMFFPFKRRSRQLYPSRWARLSHARSYLRYSASLPGEKATSVWQHASSLASSPHRPSASSCCSQSCLCPCVSLREGEILKELRFPFLGGLPSIFSVHHHHHLRSCVKLPPCSSWNTFWGAGSFASSPSWRSNTDLVYGRWIHADMRACSLMRWTYQYERLLITQMWLIENMHTSDL